MRTTLLTLLEGLTRSVAFPEPIYEFGAYRVAGQEHLPQVRDFFPGKTFVGCDLRAGVGVDELQDLHSLSLPDNSLGTALLFDTIEHVSAPWRALEEVRRCLAPGGILLMTSVWYFPVHAYPDDYFRFTSSGFRSLLHSYDSVVVASCGLERLPHTVVGVGSKGALPDREEAVIRREVEAWKRKGSRTWKETVLDVCPPFLLIPGYTAFLRTMGVINHFVLRRPRIPAHDAEHISGSPEGAITADRR
ncbi:MAG: methyltransferase domain-containing protein [Thermoanaerobaculia bacterium]